MTANIELDLKSEYLLRTRSFAKNLVASLGINSIRCATMLFHFGQSWNGSVAINSILLSSTATSGRTGGYVVVPDGFGPNEEPASSQEERISKKPSFVPRSEFNRCSDFACKFLTSFYVFSFFCVKNFLMYSMIFFPIVG